MSELLRNWLFSSLLGVNQEVRLPQSFETIAVDKKNTLEISLTDGKKGEKKRNREWLHHLHTGSSFSNIKSTGLCGYMN